jgi:hypothetical protein
MVNTKNEVEKPTSGYPDRDRIAEVLGWNEQVAPIGDEATAEKFLRQTAPTDGEDFWQGYLIDWDGQQVTREEIKNFKIREIPGGDGKEVEVFSTSWITITSDGRGSLVDNPIRKFPSREIAQTEIDSLKKRVDEMDKPKH